MTSVYHITPKSSSAQPKCPCVVKSIASDLHHFHPYQIILVRRNMFCLCSPCKISLPILKQLSETGFQLYQKHLVNGNVQTNKPSHTPCRVVLLNVSTASLVMLLYYFLYSVLLFCKSSS